MPLSNTFPQDSGNYAEEEAGKNIREEVTLKKQHLPETGLIHINSEAVTACTRSAQVQPRQNAANTKGEVDKKSHP